MPSYDRASFRVYPSHVVVADPNLRTCRGHYFETTVETIRAVKRISPHSEVIAFTNTPDADLKSALDAEPCLSRHEAALAGPWLANQSTPQALVTGAWRVTTAIASALRAYGVFARRDPVPILFTDLTLYELMIIAFLRLRHPSLQTIGSGIVRSPATDAAGRLTRKYDFLLRRATPLWRLATSRTQWWVDSPYVKEFVEAQLGQPARMAPVCVPGVWDLAGTKTDSLMGKKPMRVGFVGEPVHRRGFDLFVQTAAAMHDERHSGLLEFVATVTKPHSGETSAGSMANDVRLLNMLGKGAEARDVDLPGSRFAAAIDAADIVWSVGDPQFYGTLGTSGIYTHAMCLAKRVISNAGAWAERITAPISTARFIRYSLDEAVTALRDLAMVPADDASMAEVERWRQVHSRHSFDEFIAARLV